MAAFYVLSSPHSSHRVKHRKWKALTARLSTAQLEIVSFFFPLHFRLSLRSFSGADCSPFPLCGWQSRASLQLKKRKEKKNVQKSQREGWVKTKRNYDGCWRRGGIKVANRSFQMVKKPTFWLTIIFFFVLARHVRVVCTKYIFHLAAVCCLKSGRSTCLEMSYKKKKKKASRWWMSGHRS